MLILMVFLFFTEWTCCTDVTKPCLANMSSPFRSSHFRFDEELKTMVPHDCREAASECCEVVPWSQGIGHGYPFRTRRKTDTNEKAAHAMNM